MVKVEQSERVRAAKLAAAAQWLKRQSGVAAPFSLGFMSDRTRVPNSEIIARALPRGAAFILRDYDVARREAVARRLRSICEARGVLFFIGGDVALAECVGADGVHCPSWMTPAPAPQGMMVSAACHSAAALEAAAACGAQIAILSPVYQTLSHPDRPALGARGFKALAAASPVPVLALGGVDEANADALAGPNVAGFAAIGAFLPR